MGKMIRFVRYAPPPQIIEEEAVGVLHKGIALNRETGKMYGYHGDPGQPVVAAHKYDPEQHGAGTAIRVQSPGFGARVRSALSFRRRSDAMAPMSRTFQAHGLTSSSSHAPTAEGGQIFRHSLVSSHTTADRAAQRLAGSLGSGYRVGKVQGQNGQYGFTAKHKRTGAVHSFHFQENADVAGIHHAFNHLGSVKGSTQVKADKEGAYYQHVIRTPHAADHVDQHLRAYLGHAHDIRHRVLGNGDHSFTLRNRQSGVRTKITVQRPPKSPAAGAGPSAPAPPAAVPTPSAGATGAPAVTLPKPYRPKPASPSPEAGAPPAVPAPVPPRPGPRLSPSEALMQTNARAFRVVPKGDKFIAQGHMGEMMKVYDDPKSAEVHVGMRRQMYDRMHAQPN